MPRQHETAVYAGSFDPPTTGHVWMIEQGASLFSKLVVAVARNPEKHYTFELAQRLAWLEGIAGALPNVVIASIENEFLARYAARIGAGYVLRGIRNEDDYQYERGMRYVNADLSPSVSTVFLMPPRELCEISSSFVKGMVGPDGWEEVVGRMVPGAVLDGLRGLDAAQHGG